jgi:polysaccharide export outer membrane protein
LLKRLAHPTPDSKLIEAGDLLEVTIDSGYGEQPVRTTPVWVKDDGAAIIPEIGGVLVGGLTPQQAGLMIAARSVERGIHVPPYPFVTVQRKRQKTNQVLVIGGGVEEPGMKSLPQHASHLLGAIVASGGLTDTASSEIEIVRNSGSDPLLAPYAPRLAGGVPGEVTGYGETAPPRVTLVNLTQTTPRQRSEYELRDGDTVVVNERKPGTIHVTGLVKSAGEFELPPDRDVYLLRALAMAGGRTSQLADRVTVIRQLPEQDEPARIELSMWKAKRSGTDNILLAPGDVVSVEETPVTFALDMAQRFIRFGLSGSVPLF